MRLQLLVSTMNQKEDHSLLDKMNIQSDAVVVNQCDTNSVEEFEYKGHSVKWINMKERGVGLSRNTALLNASEDIVLFSDDDVVYSDGYEQEILKSFADTPKADVICFNIELINSIKNFGYRNNKKKKKLAIYNSMRYGACRIAARRKSLLKARVSFSLLFGGGAVYSSGEDSIFIRDCFDKNLKLFSDIYCLGQVDDSKSSWFSGINDKIFIDRGALLYNTFSKMYIVLWLYYAIRLSKKYKEYSVGTILKLFKCGKKLLKEYR